ncbi:hypothetical protein CIPAW_11G043700 [Carya illinoinensis]|uniref:Uncharacterized protein n=1 Tax=Carya illinoinensis TaxID=32201 RepID=A0A8T1P3H4_CARIL|nr:hypothetical protein CIPAW_11G043700 [Carya illinoinensis]
MASSQLFYPLITWANCLVVTSGSNTIMPYGIHNGVLKGKGVGLSQKHKRPLARFDPAICPRRGTLDNPIL